MHKTVINNSGILLLQVTDRFHVIMCTEKINLTKTDVQVRYSQLHSFTLEYNIGIKKKNYT